MFNDFRLKAVLEKRTLDNTAHEPLIDRHTLNRIEGLCDYSKRSKSAGRNNRKVIMEVLDEGRPEFLKTNRSAKQPLPLTLRRGLSTSYRICRPGGKIKKHKVISLKTYNMPLKTTRRIIRQMPNETSKTQENNHSLNHLVIKKQFMNLKNQNNQEEINNENAEDNHIRERKPQLKIYKKRTKLNELVKELVVEDELCNENLAANIKNTWNIWRRAPY